MAGFCLFFNIPVTEYEKVLQMDHRIFHAMINYKNEVLKKEENYMIIKMFAELLIFLQLINHDGIITVVPDNFFQRIKKGRSSLDFLLTCLKKKGFKVRTITEENGGLVTDLVKKYAHELNGKQIFICGPIEMIKKIKGILNREQIDKAYAYIEKRMGCGLGGCKSCAVNTLEGYKLVCKEGPVFPLKEVDFG